MTTYCWGITARKFCRMCLWSPALHCRHICSSRYDCRSSLLIPRRIFCPSFRLFQQDSISWVWNPVNGSTKLRAWTTIRWSATLLIRAAIPLYDCMRPSCVYPVLEAEMHMNTYQWNPSTWLFLFFISMWILHCAHLRGFASRDLFWSHTIKFNFEPRSKATSSENSIVVRKRVLSMCR